MKMKTKKNFFYLLILVLFMIGGGSSLSNCSDGGYSGDDIFADYYYDDFDDDDLDDFDEPSEYKPYDKLKIDKNSKVSIIQSPKDKAASLTFDDIKALVTEAVELAGGLQGIVKDGDTVVLKPNLVTMKDYCLPGWQGRPLTAEANGNCTDWRVTKAVAQLVREINPSGKIYIMEGSAVNTLEVFKALNYTKEHIPEVDDILAIELDSGAWGDKNSDGLVKVNHNTGLYRKEYYFNKKIYRADALICLPTLKNHWSAVVTGSVKNLAIGATPANIYGGQRQGDTNRGASIEHDTLGFHQWMADYYTCRPADFTVMDALQGLENGPTPCYDQAGVTHIENAQKNMRAILASKDGLAIDVVQTNIMNWDIETVEYLKLLTRAGNVGNGNSKNIVVLGKKVDDIRENFAGVLPPYGGKPLSGRRSPSLSIESAEFDGDELKLKLDISDNTDKLDIYIDGVYAGSVNNEMKDITFNVDPEKFGGGKKNITVYSYDKHMNHAEANITADK